MNPHFENYFIGRASLLGEVIYYHLTLEALLSEILRRNTNAETDKNFRKLMFAKKAEECFKLGKLSKELYHAVLALNRVRNQYAHELGYEISLDAALALARICGEGGVEFTDGIDKCTLDQAEELGYDTLSLLNETFRNTFFEVAYSQGEEEWQEFVS